MYVIEYLQEAITDYTVNPHRDYLDPEDLPFERNKSSQTYKQAGIIHDRQAVFAMKQVLIHTYIHTYIHSHIHVHTVHTYIQAYVHSSYKYSGIMSY